MARELREDEMWPFSIKPKPSLPINLIFKSGEAFFEYQCKFGHTEIVSKQGLVALVLDSRTEFGTDQPVKIEADGIQMATLKVVSDDGGFIVISKTVSNKGDQLIPGDVVVWVPIQHMGPQALEAAELDTRFGWAGFIVAKVKPEIDTASPDLSIVCRYD